MSYKHDLVRRKSCHNACICDEEGME